MGARGVPAKFDRDEVHQVALTAYRDGVSMGSAIAAHFGITESAGRAWVVRLRAAGYDVPMVRADKATEPAEVLLDVLYASKEEWVKDAACIGSPARVFFPERGELSQFAKDICAQCPVCEECLDYALRTCEKFGIWGGTSERERRAMRRKSNADRREAYRGAVA